jgi:hypothetical protein
MPGVLSGLRRAGAARLRLPRSCQLRTGAAADLPPEVILRGPGEQARERATMRSTLEIPAAVPRKGSGASCATRLNPDEPFRQRTETVAGTAVTVRFAALCGRSPGAGKLAARQISVIRTSSSGNLADVAAEHISGYSTGTQGLGCSP